AEHIVRTRRQGDDVVVVVSAMGKTTDDLEQLAHGVSHVPAAREMDMLQPAVSVPASQAGIVTDTTHRKAKIVEVRADRIREAIAGGVVAIVAGFQGVSTARDVTTLGRGGSDTSAVAL